MFGSSQWMYNSGGGFYEHEIAGSARFNADGSGYLSRTPSSAGNRRTFTFSAWVKRAAVGGSDKCIFSQYNGSDNNNRAMIQFDNGVNLMYRDYTGGTSKSITSTAVFRDPAAWYHIVCRIDTTQSTASNRARLYVNGEQITDFGTEQYVSQNHEGSFNRAAPHQIGSHGTGSLIDGHIAEVHFIDGQSLGPTSFGESKSGVWIPKKYSGSYGTNGYYLKFDGNVNDSSGNGNNWTANNVNSDDLGVTDSPTNNFAVFNPLAESHEDYTGTFTSQEAGLRANGFTNQDMNAQSTFAVRSGKWYSEIYIANRGSDDHRNGVGIGTNGQKRIRSKGVVYQPNGQKCVDDSRSSYGATYTTGDIIGIALNADNNQVTFYKNGSSQGTISFTPQHDFITVFAGYSTNASSYLQVVANAGQDGTFTNYVTAQGNSDANGYGDFRYSVPSGYLAPCSQNLSIADAISPEEENSPQDYFSTILYTGNSTARSITGVGFSPDWIWIKSRNHAHNPEVFDIVRGTQKALMPSQPDSEVTRGVTSFDSDGFSLDTSQYTNQDTKTFVAWCWDAGGTAVSNTDGDITSSVSANTDAGFSVVAWTHDGGSNPRQIGHGLNQAPDMIISKHRNANVGWYTYHRKLALGKTMFLHQEDGAATNGDFGNSHPTDSIFYFAGTGVTGRQLLAYCFHSVEGYSHFGTYVGAGGKAHVHTGFRPAFVMIKTTATDGWAMFDSVRDPDNGLGFYLYANSSQGQDPSPNTRLDFLSNGFRIRNNSGPWGTDDQSYIYMAFAENPFKFANAR